MSTSLGSAPRHLASITAVLVSIVVLVALVAGIAGSEVPSGDFIAYWAAGRLNAQMLNPYGPQAVMQIQQAIGWAESAPRMIWYPPWILPLLTPLGMLDYRTARLLWLGLNVALTILCADWIWLSAGGPRDRRWIAWLIGLLFAPSLINLAAGQISAFLLVGLVGFLAFARRGRWWWSGVSVALVTAKPQFLYLFLIALGLWLLVSRRWTLILGTVASIMGMTAIALAIHPHVVSEWLGAAAATPPDYWITPTLGSILRLAFGWNARWLALAPAIAGVIWLGYYWRRRRARWQWDQETPWLLLACAVTTVFAWTFDLTVLLLAVIPALLWIRELPSGVARASLLGSYAAINLLALLSVPLVEPMRQDSLQPITLADPNRSWGYAIALAFALWYYAAYRVRRSALAARSCREPEAETKNE
jgi:hypothetical protein